jgi:basic amino acid/polyamine antiporter, APA family
MERRMGLLALMATGICSMIGASIHVVPFMIQKNIPGIGPYVLPAFLLAAIPAILAGLAYAKLAKAMPRAGGSYIFASRGLHPYLGFIASFSQWFGLSIVIGVVAYVTIPFLRDVAYQLNWKGVAENLENGAVRVSLALGLVWLFVWVNIKGIKTYERIVIPLMIMMFATGALVIIAGLWFDPDDFSIAARISLDQYSNSAPFDWMTFLSAGTLLFASFIGFDSIAQAGGEAKNPDKKLPLAIGLTILIVGLYYLAFTAAVYRIIPWEYVTEQAQLKDISAPGLLSPLLPEWINILIIGGAAIALINDLPAMLLSVSRMIFAWSKDGIFPAKISAINPSTGTPHLAIIWSGIFASIGILGSHFAGDFFLGIDIMVTSMMVNFLLMCLTLLTIPKVNPKIAQRINKGFSQKIIGGTGVLVLTVFLIIHTIKDFKSGGLPSTPFWLIAMGIGSAIYFFHYFKIKKSGKDFNQIFKELP